MRTLHLLDIEYLGCGPTLTSADLTLVMDRYRPLVGCQPGDHLVGAASNWVYVRVAFDAPDDIRLLPAGGGADAADLKLIEEAHTIDLTRYDRVAVASGDHRFADLVHECHEQGIATCVAGYGFNTSHMLAAGADVFVDLAGPLALAA